MSKLLHRLGVFGFSAEKENQLLQSLITGDPALMIGTQGAAKTLVAKAVGQSLGLNFQAYDASKAMFEDILGMPNPAALSRGEMDYIQGPLTLWDKDFLLIDEVNRAAPELQSKWLEILRSRQVMGLPLNVKFIWGAMNPFGFEGTNQMDAAYLGRFATFVYVPTSMEMEDDTRIEVINCVGLDDSPAANFWVQGDKQSDEIDFEGVGKELVGVLRKAQEHYHILVRTGKSVALSNFLAKYSRALFVNNAELELDGRRLGMMRRAVLATRAVELAKAEVYGERLVDFATSAKRAIVGSIPIGLNEEGAKNEDLSARVENVFSQLSDFFTDDGDVAKLEVVYKLLVSPCIYEKVEILLTSDLNDLTQVSAWSEVCNNTSFDMSILAMVALQIEVQHPGTIPANVIDQLTKRMSSQAYAFVNAMGSGVTSVNVGSDYPARAQEVIEVFENAADPIENMIIESISKEHFSKPNTSTANVDGFLSDTEAALAKYRSIKSHVNS